jgi:hypothetical protein
LRAAPRHCARTRAAEVDDFCPSVPIVATFVRAGEVDPRGRAGCLGGQVGGGGLVGRCYQFVT